MQENNSPHIPVLFNEVINTFKDIKEGYIIDCTLGYGGHSLGILESNPNIKLICNDQDDEALSFSKNRLSKYANRVIFNKGNFISIFTHQLIIWAINRKITWPRKGVYKHFWKRSAATFWNSYHNIYMIFLHINFDDLKLSTIPQRIGLYNTKILGYFGVFLLFVFISQNTNTVAFISSSLTLLFLLLFLTKSRPGRSVYFTAFWVESLPIIWWIMWFVLDKLK